jgi:hypothetical protein
MRWVLWAAWLVFVAVTGWALWEVGYLGIFQAGLASAGAVQILVDLVVACGFASAWVIGDARRNGRNPWPWVAVVPLFGSLPLLTYVVLRPWLSSSPVPAASADPR